MFTILRNQHISSIRREARAGIAVDPDDVAPVLATRPNQEHSLAVDALEDSLKALPDEQRDLIELVSLEGLSYDDVARRYGLAVGTVKSRISRGRSQLRKSLEGHVRSGDPAGRPWSEGAQIRGRRVDGRRASGRSVDQSNSDIDSSELAA